MEVAFFLLLGATIALLILGLGTIVSLAVVCRPLVKSAMVLAARVDVPGAKAEGEFSLEAANDQFYDPAVDELVIPPSRESLDARKTAQNALGTDLPFSEAWAKADPRDGFQARSDQEKGHVFSPRSKNPKKCSFCEKVKTAFFGLHRPRDE